MVDAPLGFVLDQQLLTGLISNCVPHNLSKLTYLHIYSSAFNVPVINCPAPELKSLPGSLDSR